MAKKQESLGGGKLHEQIARIKKIVGRDGVRAAQEIIETYNPDVIRLAFKLIPKGPNVNGGLGKRIEAMLANMPKNQAAEMREKLLAAKA